MKTTLRRSLLVAGVLASACGGRASTNPCEAGLTRCGGVCVDERIDAANCGACGHACFVAQACVDRVCECPAGESACDGACIDPQSDWNHCGAAADCTGGVVCDEGDACGEGSCQTAWYDVHVTYCGIGIPAPRCNFHFDGSKIIATEDPYYVAGGNSVDFGLWSYSDSYGNAQTYLGWAWLSTDGILYTDVGEALN